MQVASSTAFHTTVMVSCDSTVLPESLYTAHVIQYIRPSPASITSPLLLASLPRCCSLPFPPPCHLYYDKTVTGSQPRDSKKKKKERNPAMVLPTKLLIYLNVTSSHLGTEGSSRLEGLLRKITAAARHAGGRDQSGKTKADKRAQEGKRVRD